MRAIKTIIFVFLSLILWNCSNDGDSDMEQESESMNNPPEDTTELVFQLNISIDTETTDDWIIVHNDQGELIDFSSYESGDTVTIEAESNLVTDNITITNFTNTRANGNDFYNFVSYPEIPKGSTWNFKPFATQTNRNESRGENEGNFEVIISNIPFSTELNVSNKFGAVGGTGGSTGSTTTRSIARFENVTETMIVATEAFGSSKYIIIDTPPEGTDLNIDYSEFLEFDSFVNVDIPSNQEYSSRVFAFEANQEFMNVGGFNLNLTFPFNSTFPVQLGYIDSFEKYLTQLSFNNETYFYSYENYGAKPDAIVVLENPSVTILNSSLKDFEFNTLINFERVNNTFSTSEGTFNENFVQTSWTIVLADSDKRILGDIPEEILSTYPQINIEDLKLDSTRLFLNFDSYQEYLDKRFISEELNSPFESEEFISFFN